jgi:hypothetical protein
MCIHITDNTSDNDGFAKTYVRMYVIMCSLHAEKRIRCRHNSFPCLSNFIIRRGWPILSETCSEYKNTKINILKILMPGTAFLKYTFLCNGCCWHGDEHLCATVSLTGSTSLEAGCCGCQADRWFIRKLSPEQLTPSTALGILHNAHFGFHPLISRGGSSGHPKLHNTQTDFNWSPPLSHPKCMDYILQQPMYYLLTEHIYSFTISIILFENIVRK